MKRKHTIKIAQTRLRLLRELLFEKIACCCLAFLSHTQREREIVKNPSAKRDKVFFGTIEQL